MKTPISFRLRKELDADLIAAASKVDKESIKDLCRDGLRLMLGLTTTRTVEIHERPLAVPQQRSTVATRLEVERSVARTVPGKAAVFMPQKKRS